jgi:thiol:disulfide interchange protein
MSPRAGPRHLDDGTIGVMRTLLLALLVACGTPGHSGQRLLSYEIEDANNAKKPLVIELHNKACKPCQTFDQEVLADPKVKQALDGIVFVRYDADSPAGRDAVERTGTKSFPTLLVVDSDGVIKAQRVGSEPSAEELLDFIKQAHDVSGR